MEDEYSWVHKLIEIGCSLDKIAELLLEKYNDAPWIYFKYNAVLGPDVISRHHLGGCVHGGGHDLSVIPALVDSVP